MTHDPLCRLFDPCRDDEPNHGYCSFSAPRYCIHCHRWCICDRLEKVRADERERCGREAQEAVARLDIRSDRRYTVNDQVFHLAWRDGWQTGHDAANTAARGEA